MAFSKNKENKGRKLLKQAKICDCQINTKSEDGLWHASRGENMNQEHLSTWLWSQSVTLLEQEGIEEQPTSGRNLDIHRLAPALMPLQDFSTLLFPHSVFVFKRLCSYKLILWHLPALCYESGSSVSLLPLKFLLQSSTFCSTLHVSAIQRLHSINILMLPGYTL